MMQAIAALLFVVTCLGNLIINFDSVTALEPLVSSNVKCRHAFPTTVFLVPGCDFKLPEPGGVDLRTSFPLSRFVKDTESLNVSFAIQGANNNSAVSLA
ncbi:hypothetical protein TcWFU_001073 [Taenia crassiceps]|uniref:DUF5727 domain-containing protein n=1 Tax=Taenia crassiceps TaxID=6207 RepID=A0ABR4QJR8_9CEST